ncbi:sulfotransferase [Salinibacter ruber]|uniref:sulfotransferase n=1 Tax=Salinibacter ruber TaxID=146919 RepID=UPI00161F8509|nr:sulfotransferase [Salinibacter ruber]MBB4062387.1 hypothetical protein [Salinibacter ruber]
MLLRPSAAVVVTGFWRSGTTWLQQLLAEDLRAKSVLEPLYPRFHLFRDEVLPELMPQIEVDLSLLAFIPFCKESLDRTQILASYFKRALTSSLPGVYVRTTRYDTEKKKGCDSLSSKVYYRIRDSLKTKVVVKFTRAHLMLPEIHSYFRPDVLHIRRDPRAVWASLKRTGWEWPREFSLVTHLLELDDGRRALFDDQSELIREIDRMGPAARIGGYWACLEQEVQRYKDSGGNFSIVTYRQLCLEGTDHLAEVLSQSHTDTSTSFELNRNSYSTQRSRENASLQQRVYGWKNELPGAEVRDIEQALKKLDATDLLPDK